MKVIQSGGGPLIGLDRDLVNLWSANTGKAFIGNKSPYIDDYDALSFSQDGTPTEPWLIKLFRGASVEALLISMPFETAIIQSDARSVFLAQVEYADPEWSFSLVKFQYFQSATFDEGLRFHSSGSRYSIFDSAYVFSEVGDDSLDFKLEEGDYVVSAATYRPDDRTSLLLYKIISAY